MGSSEMSGDTYPHTIEEHEEAGTEPSFPEGYARDECDECHLCICEDPSEIGPGEHRTGCSSYDWGY